MSTFSGKAYKGAMRDHRENKRAEAEARNAAANAWIKPCRHVHGEGRMCEGWE